MLETVLPPPWTGADDLLEKFGLKDFYHQMQSTRPATHNSGSKLPPNTHPLKTQTESAVDLPGKIMPRQENLFQRLLAEPPPTSNIVLFTQDQLKAFTFQPGAIPGFDSSVLGLDIIQGSYVPLKKHTPPVIAAPVMPAAVPMPQPKLSTKITSSSTSIGDQSPIITQTPVLPPKGAPPLLPTITIPRDGRKDQPSTAESTIPTLAQGIVLSPTKLVKIEEGEEVIEGHSSKGNIKIKLNLGNLHKDRDKKKKRKKDKDRDREKDKG